MKQLSRRGFLRTGVAAAGALSVAGCSSVSIAKPAVYRKPGDRLNMAFIGSGGRGGANLKEFYDLGEQVVAVCDVDRGRLDHSANVVKERCPDVRKYQDFRELLAAEKDLDAVVVSTPDHMHAAAAIAAMKQGCHVYVEKPLVRTVWEARRFAKVAQACGVMTQMGNNGNGSDQQRRNIEIVQSGVLGDIREIHVSTDRPIWPQALNRPEGSDPVPPALDWELWLCGAPLRPFKERVYHRYNWRGWHDFGTGALGDVGCQLLSLPFRALDVRAPRMVTTEEVDGATAEMYPRASHVQAVFDAPARRRLPVTLSWYDGGRRPAAIRLPEVVQSLGTFPGGGCLLVGEDGVWLMADETGERHRVALAGEKRLVDAEKHEACALAPLPPKGADTHACFLDALRAGAPEPADASHMRALMETVLTGCVAQRVPGRLAWNSRKRRFDGSDEANRLVATAVRDGWGGPL